eukprot:Colp12_sorted_trinity150504_noHs@8485
MYADLLVGNDVPKAAGLGTNLEAHTYGSGERTRTFLSNINTSGPSNVTFMGRVYDLPPWSVSFVDASGAVLYNTAQVRAPTVVRARHSEDVQSLDGRNGPLGATYVWQEEKGIPEGPATHQSPPDLLMTTQYTSDYMWLSQSLGFQAPVGAKVELGGLKDFVVHVYLERQYQGSVYSSSGSVALNIAGSRLELLLANLGTTNYGAHMERYTQQLNKVKVNGKDVTKGAWQARTGLT